MKDRTHQPAATHVTAPKAAATALPVRVDRRTAAELVTRLYFPVSPRTVEAWPLTVRRVNGKATIETAELFAYAEAKLDAAPAIKGGRRRTAAM